MSDLLNSREFVSLPGVSKSIDSKNDEEEKTKHILIVVNSRKLIHSKLLRDRVHEKTVVTAAIRLLRIDCKTFCTGHDLGF